MKKYCIIFLLCLSTSYIFSQEVIINGFNKNRLLTWEDFKGKPDFSISHDANTYWTINYSLSGVSFNGNQVNIKQFSTRLQFDETKSWIKEGKQSVDLLNHEQGHFNLGLICQHELITQFNSTVFLKDSWQQQIKTLFTTTLEKYQELGKKYDTETNHSKNKGAQENWDQFFITEMKW